MPTRSPPIACHHIPAEPGWFCVFDVDLAGGKLELYREPVIAWRADAFEVEKRGSSDRFSTLTPILAGGSVSEQSLYVLQFASVYFSGDERLEKQEDVIAWFKKQRSRR